MHYLPQPSPGDVRAGFIGALLLLAVAAGISCLAVYGLATLLYRGWVL